MSRRNAEHRRQRMAIGRTDYLKPDGTVGETYEYTDKEKKLFKRDIEVANEIGSPIHAYIYRGISGQPRCRIKTGDLNPMTAKVEIIDNPYLDYLTRYYGKGERK